MTTFLNSKLVAIAMCLTTPKGEFENSLNWKARILIIKMAINSLWSSSVLCFRIQLKHLFYPLPLYS